MWTRFYPRLAYRVRLQVGSRRWQSTEPPKDPLPTFLNPQVSVHGDWAEPAEPRDRCTYEASEWERPVPDKDSKWTLSERRGLFLYVRAMKVHYNDRRDINWEFIGQRLERSPNICRFMYQIIEWQWYQSKHHDSAMTLKKLQAQMRQHDAGATIKQLHSRRFPALPGVPKDQRLETRGWIRLLCHPPDPVYKSTVDDDVNTCRRWTAEEHDRFVDMLTVHQRPPASVLEEIAQALDRSRKAVLERFNIIRYRTSAKDAAPLTDDERKTILDQAAKQSGLLRWGDVKGLLPGRTYAEVNRQLTYSSTRKCPHPQQSANE